MGREEWVWTGFPVGIVIYNVILMRIVSKCSLWLITSTLLDGKGNVTLDGVSCLNYQL